MSWWLAGAAALSTAYGAYNDHKGNRQDARNGYVLGGLLGSAAGGSALLGSGAAGGAGAASGAETAGAGTVGAGDAAASGGSGAAGMTKWGPLASQMLRGYSQGSQSQGQPSYQPVIDDSPLGFPQQPEAMNMNGYSPLAQGAPMANATGLPVPYNDPNNPAVINNSLNPYAVGPQPNSGLFNLRGMYG